MMKDIKTFFGDRRSGKTTFLIEEAKKYPASLILTPAKIPVKYTLKEHEGEYNATEDSFKHTGGTIFVRETWNPNIWRGIDIAVFIDEVDVFVQTSLQIKNLKGVAGSWQEEGIE